MTGGLHAGELIILAARPSMGKTALALNIAQHVATHPQMQKPVAIFSLEMSSGQPADALAVRGRSRRPAQVSKRATLTKKSGRKLHSRWRPNHRIASVSWTIRRASNLMDVHSQAAATEEHTARAWRW